MPIYDTGPMSLDIRLYCGDVNRMDLEIVANDPVDLTGAVIEAQARTTAPDPEIALTATVVDTVPAQGTFALEWSDEAAQRALVAGGQEWKGVWDLQILMAGETLPRTLLRGTAVLVHDVTRVEGTP